MPWRHTGRVIYLDHNATTPILPEVLEAMLPYLTTEWGNPSSTYKFGAKLRTVIETARAQVAELIGAQSRDVIFTSCATESNNAAIHAALKANPGKLADSDEPSHVVRAKKPESAASRQMIRFSLGAANTLAAIKEVSSTVERAATMLRG